jgi:hypothetical protein
MEMVEAATGRVNGGDESAENFDKNCALLRFEKCELTFVVEYLQM